MQNIHPGSILLSRSFSSLRDISERLSLGQSKIESAQVFRKEVVATIKKVLGETSTIKIAGLWRYSMKLWSETLKYGVAVSIYQ